MGAVTLIRAESVKVRVKKMEIAAMVLDVFKEVALN